MKLCPRLFIERLLIRNDIHVQVSQLDQPVRQALFAQNEILPMVHAAHHDFGHAADPGVFRDLLRRINPVDRGDLGPQLFRQTQVAPQPFDVFSRQLLCLRRLNK